MDEKLLTLIYWRISIVWTSWTFRSELPQLGLEALDSTGGVVIHQIRPGVAVRHHFSFKKGGFSGVFQKGKSGDFPVKMDSFLVNLTLSCSGKSYPTPGTLSLGFLGPKNPHQDERTKKTRNKNNISCLRFIYLFIYLRGYNLVPPNISFLRLMYLGCILSETNIFAPQN